MLILLLLLCSPFTPVLIASAVWFRKRETRIRLLAALARGRVIVRLLAHPGAAAWREVRGGN